MYAIMSKNFFHQIYEEEFFTPYKMEINKTQNIIKEIIIAKTTAIKVQPKIELGKFHLKNELIIIKAG